MTIELAMSQAVAGDGTIVQTPVGHVGWTRPIVAALGASDSSVALICHHYAEVLSIVLPQSSSGPIHHRVQDGAASLLRGEWSPPTRALLLRLPLRFIAVVDPILQVDEVERLRKESLISTMAEVASGLAELGLYVRGPRGSRRSSARPL